MMHDRLLEHLSGRDRQNLLLDAETFEVIGRSYGSVTPVLSIAQETRSRSHY